MIHYKFKCAKEQDIYKHLLSCDNSFIPALHIRVNLHDFSKKIFEKTTTFEVWENDILVSLLSIYLNNDTRTAFINNLSVLQKYRKKKFASLLMNNCIEYIKKLSFKQLYLEVNTNNEIAIKFYNSLYFKEIEKSNDNFIILAKDIL